MLKNVGALLFTCVQTQEEDFAPASVACLANSSAVAASSGTTPGSETPVMLLSTPLPGLTRQSGYELCKNSLHCRVKVPRQSRA